VGHREKKKKKKKKKKKSVCLFLFFFPFQSHTTKQINHHQPKGDEIICMLFISLLKVNGASK
ncbi:hypothetical protein ACVQ92_11420, partial [Staphylococcus aureus]